MCLLDVVVLLLGGSVLLELVQDLLDLVMLSGGFVPVEVVEDLLDMVVMLLLGGSVPVEVVEDLLDLLCYYNSAEPPETPYIEELHFRLYFSEKKANKTNKNTWK